MKFYLDNFTNVNLWDMQDENIHNDGSGFYVTSEQVFDWYVKLELSIDIVDEKIGRDGIMELESVGCFENWEDYITVADNIEDYMTLAMNLIKEREEAVNELAGLWLQGEDVYFEHLGL